MQSSCRRTLRRSKTIWARWMTDRQRLEGMCLTAQKSMRTGSSACVSVAAVGQHNHSSILRRSQAATSGPRHALTAFLLPQMPHLDDLLLEVLGGNVEHRHDGPRAPGAGLPAPEVCGLRPQRSAGECEAGTLLQGGCCARGRPARRCWRRCEHHCASRHLSYVMSMCLRFQHNVQYNVDCARERVAALSRLSGYLTPGAASSPNICDEVHVRFSRSCCCGLRNSHPIRH